MPLAVCSLFLLLSLTLFWQAFGIAGPAGLYPTVVTGGTVLFSAAYLVQQVLRRRATGPDRTAFALTPGVIARTALFILSWVAYVLLLPYGGFIVTTVAALLTSLWILRGRLGTTDFLAVAAFVLGLAVVMKVVLYVPVPQGWLDQQLELLLYRMI